MVNARATSLTPAEQLSLMMATWSQMTVCSVLCFGGSDGIRPFGYASAALSAVWLLVIIIRWDMLSARVIGLLDNVREAFDESAPKGITNGVSSKSKLKRRLRGLDTESIMLLTDLTDAEEQAVKAKGFLRRALIPFIVQALLLYGAMGVLALVGTTTGRVWFVVAPLLLAGAAMRFPMQVIGALDKAWAAYSKAHSYVNTSPVEPDGQSPYPSPAIQADPGLWAGIWWSGSLIAILASLVPGSGPIAAVVSILSLTSMAVAHAGLNGMYGSHPAPPRKVGQLRARVAILGMESSLTALPLWGLASLGDAIPWPVLAALAILALPTMYSYAMELPAPAAVKWLKGSMVSR